MSTLRYTLLAAACCMVAMPLLTKDDDHNRSRRPKRSVGKHVTPWLAGAAVTLGVVGVGAAVVAARNNGERAKSMVVHSPAQSAKHHRGSSPAALTPPTPPPPPPAVSIVPPPVTKPGPPPPIQIPNDEAVAIPEPPEEAVDVVELNLDQLSKITLSNPKNYFEYGAGRYALEVIEYRPPRCRAREGFLKTPLPKGSAVVRYRLKPGGEHLLRTDGTRLWASIPDSTPPQIDPDDLETVSESGYTIFPPAVNLVEKVDCCRSSFGLLFRAFQRPGQSKDELWALYILMVNRNLITLRSLPKVRKEYKKALAKNNNEALPALWEELNDMERADKWMRIKLGKLPREDDFYLTNPDLDDPTPFRNAG